MQQGSTFLKLGLSVYNSKLTLLCTSACQCTALQQANTLCTQAWQSTAAGRHFCATEPFSPVNRSNQTVLRTWPCQCTALYFRSIVTLHSFRLKHCSVDYIVHCSRRLLLFTWAFQCITTANQHLSAPRPGHCSRETRLCT